MNGGRSHLASNNNNIPNGIMVRPICCDEKDPCYLIGLIYEPDHAWSVWKCPICRAETKIRVAFYTPKT